MKIPQQSDPDLLHDSIDFVGRRVTDLISRCHDDNGLVNDLLIIKAELNRMRGYSARRHTGTTITVQPRI